jgi:hypothetical protein
MLSFCTIFFSSPGGRDANGIVADRYCGNALNPAALAVPAGAATATTPVLAGAVPGGSATSVQVCSKLCRVIPIYTTYLQALDLIQFIITAPIRPFRMTYQTDGTEAPIITINAPTVPVLAAADTALLPILDYVLTTKNDRLNQYVPKVSFED